MKDCTTCKYGFVDEQLGFLLCHHPLRFSDDCVDFNMHEEIEEPKKATGIEEKKLPEGLEKAAGEYAVDNAQYYYEDDDDAICSTADILKPAFIAGAEWQKEQDQPITGNSLEQEWLRYVDKKKKEYGGELPSLGEYGWLQIARHFAEWKYQKDRGEFAKLKAKEWSDGYDEGIVRGKEKMLEEAVEGVAEELYNDGEPQCTVGVGTYFQPGEEVYVIKKEDGK